MAAFAASTAITRSRYENSLTSNKTTSSCPSTWTYQHHAAKANRTEPLCTASPRYKPVNRRTVLSLLAASIVYRGIETTHAERLKIEPYDANKSRRYVDIGRPAPDRPMPKFATDKPVFKIDEELAAQDVKTGNGDPVKKGTLVRARWLSVLADGTTVDDFNESQAALFRPGAHQVPPGIEDAIVGMQAGGLRRVAGTSERILSNISLGSNIGERSLVPNGSTVYIDIFVDQVDPYGNPR